MFPSLEVHIPISANDFFLRMTHYMVRSLRVFGGPYADAKIVLTIGEPEIRADLHQLYPWIEREGVEVRWVPLDKYARDTYYATAIERFCYRFESDVVLMLDADILIARPFTDLITQAHLQQSFGGLIAHISPFPDTSRWQDLFSHVGMGPAKLRYEHTGFGYLHTGKHQRFCPPYFNLGVLCAPATLMNQVGEHIYELMYKTAELEDLAYKCQIAVCLAIEKLGMRHHLIQPRYNFPNDRSFEALYGAEQPFTSIIHILRENQGISKNWLYEDPAHIREALARDDLRCTNKLIQEVLRVIAPMIGDA